MPINSHQFPFLFFMLCFSLPRDAPVRMTTLLAAMMSFYWLLIQEAVFAGQENFG
jgi:hypothetical protein